METGAYERLMSRLVLEALRFCDQETGNSPVELILSPRDLARLGRSFVEEISRELKKEGSAFRGGLTLGQADPALTGGFFLRQGKIVQNYSLENLVNAKREELLPEIGRRLFSQH
jgi:vacuolar-type H+-ATPase subunit E/Vma4